MAETESGQSPRVRLMEGQEVSLGCGTLIIIAIIVMFFSGRGTKDVEQEVRGLKSEVVELRESVDALKASVDKLNREGNGPQKEKE